MIELSFFRRRFERRLNRRKIDLLLAQKYDEYDALAVSDALMYERSPMRALERKIDKGVSVWRRLKATVYLVSKRLRASTALKLSAIRLKLWLMISARRDRIIAGLRSARRTCNKD